MPYDGNRSDNKPVLPEGWRGSTALNSTIKSYEDLAYRVKAQLGFPVTDLEVSDEQVAIFIDEALEWYTQYAGTERKWLIFRDYHYVEGCGVKLDELVRTDSIKSECFTTTSATEVTGNYVSYSPVGGGNNPSNVACALLSVSPFMFPSTEEPTLSGQGQKIILKFDKDCPWDAFAICNAECFTIKPRGSDCWSLSSHVDEINFSNLILTYPNLSGLLDNPIISADNDGILPVSALNCEILTSIPTSYYNTSSFYASADLCGFPVTACLEIKNGQGVLYPSCDKDSIECSNLSATWTIDPDFSWTIVGNMLSGEDGRMIEFSEMDITNCANAVSIPGLPSCSIIGGIPLHENGGYFATFFICNSAIDTNGQWEVSNVQFLKTYTPPEEVMNERFCDIQNKGFTITKTITAHEDCISNTAQWIPVNVCFQDTTVTDLTGTVVTTCSGGYDNELNYRRKVNSVFSMDYTMGNGGFYGSNLLFSFETGVIGNAFGFDMQGNRNLYRNGYDMLGYELARGFIDQVQRMVNYASYEFNPDNQWLKIIPEPYPVARETHGGRCYIIGAHVEKPLVELINKKWVQEWTKARIMETVGYIRAKFGNVTLYGGASIQGDTLVTMGREDITRLLKELRDDNYYAEPPLFFIG